MATSNRTTIERSVTAYPIGRESTRKASRFASRRGNREKNINSPKSRGLQFRNTSNKARVTRERERERESGACAVIDPSAGREGLLSTIRHPLAHGWTSTADWSGMATPLGVSWHRSGLTTTCTPSTSSNVLAPARTYAPKSGGASVHAATSCRAHRRAYLRANKKNCVQSFDRVIRAWSFSFEEIRGLGVGRLFEGSVNEARWVLAGIWMMTKGHEVSSGW